MNRKTPVLTLTHSITQRTRRSWLTTHGTVWTSDSAGIYLIDPLPKTHALLVHLSPGNARWRTERPSRDAAEASRALLASRHPAEPIGPACHSLSWRADLGPLTIEITGAVFERLTRMTAGSPFLLYVALLAAVKICLYKYSRSQMITVGGPPRRAGEIGRAHV